MDIDLIPAQPLIGCKDIKFSSGTVIFQSHNDVSRSLAVVGSDSISHSQDHTHLAQSNHFVSKPNQLNHDEIASNILDNSLLSPLVGELSPSPRNISRGEDDTINSIVTGKPTQTYVNVNGSVSLDEPSVALEMKSNEGGSPVRNLTAKSIENSIVGGSNVIKFTNISPQIQPEATDWLMEKSNEWVELEPDISLFGDDMTSEEEGKAEEEGRSKGITKEQNQDAMIGGADKALINTEMVKNNINRSPLSTGNESGYSEEWSPFDLTTDDLLDGSDKCLERASNQIQCLRNEHIMNNHENSAGEKERVEGVENIQGNNKDNGDGIGSVLLSSQCKLNINHSETKKMQIDVVSFKEESGLVHENMTSLSDISLDDQYKLSSPPIVLSGGHNNHLITPLVLQSALPLQHADQSIILLDTSDQLEQSTPRDPKSEMEVTPVKICRLTTPNRERPLGCASSGTSAKKVDAGLFQTPSTKAPISDGSTGESSILLVRRRCNRPIIPITRTPTPEISAVKTQSRIHSSSITSASSNMKIHKAINPPSSIDSPSPLIRRVSRRANLILTPTPDCTATKKKNKPARSKTPDSPIRRHRPMVNKTSQPMKPNNSLTNEIIKKRRILKFTQSDSDNSLSEGEEESMKERRRANETENESDGSNADPIVTNDYNEHVNDSDDFEEDDSIPIRRDKRSLEKERQQVIEQKEHQRLAVKKGRRMFIEDEAEESDMDDDEDDNDLGCYDDSFVVASYDEKEESLVQSSNPVDISHHDDVITSRFSSPANGPEGEAQRRDLLRHQLGFTPSPPSPPDKPSYIRNLPTNQQQKRQAANDDIEDDDFLPMNIRQAPLTRHSHTQQNPIEAHHLLTSNQDKETNQKLARRVRLAKQREKQLEWSNTKGKTENLVGSMGDFKRIMPNHNLNKPSLEDVNCTENVPEAANTSAKVILGETSPPIILVDSAEVSSSQINSTLCTVYQLPTSIRHLGCCSYVLSKRIGVIRASPTEMIAANQRKKLFDRVASARIVFQKPIVILEERANRNNNAKSASAIIAYERGLATLVSYKVIILPSISQDHTARLIHRLSVDERDKGWALPCDIKDISESSQAIKFLMTLPMCGFYTAAMIKLTNKNMTLRELIN
eukprot:Ihof_evm2s746 gene=Ihof_evmTU2s746